jgi:hypothetical protein
MKTLISVIRYLLITAILFVGIDHFMANEQGLIALPIAVLWFVWSFGNAQGGQPANSVPDTGVADEYVYWNNGDITGCDWK